MYEMSAKFAQMEFVGVPLNADALVYLAYPNNPTGTLYDDADIERVIAAASKNLVVIDEAGKIVDAARSGIR